MNVDFEYIFVLLSIEEQRDFITKYLRLVEEEELLDYIIYNIGITKILNNIDKKDIIDYMKNN